MFYSVETTTTVTQSITSPVTSISTEPGNSNDSLSQPPILENSLSQGPIMNSFAGPTQHGPPPMMAEEPVEKKRKTVKILYNIYFWYIFEVLICCYLVICLNIALF